jgi:hypothetical protein
VGESDGSAARRRRRWHTRSLCPSEAGRVSENRLVEEDERDDGDGGRWAGMVALRPRCVRSVGPAGLMMLQGDALAAVNLLNHDCNLLRLLSACHSLQPQRVGC